MTEREARQEIEAVYARLNDHDQRIAKLEKDRLGLVHAYELLYKEMLAIAEALEAEDITAQEAVGQMCNVFRRAEAERTRSADN